MLRFSTLDLSFFVVHHLWPHSIFQLLSTIIWSYVTSTSQYENGILSPQRKVPLYFSATRFLDNFRSLWEQQKMLEHFKIRKKVKVLCLGHVIYYELMSGSKVEGHLQKVNQIYINRNKDFLLKLMIKWKVHIRRE